MLALARATRDSLVAQEQAALQRVRELEIIMEIAEDEMEDVRRRLKEAESQVGAVQRSLEARGIEEKPRLDSTNIASPLPFRCPSSSPRSSSSHSCN